MRFFSPPTDHSPTALPQPLASPPRRYRSTASHCIATAFPPLPRPSTVASTPATAHQPRPLNGETMASRTLAIHLFRKVRTIQYGSPRLLHHGPDTVEELLDRHIVKEERKSLNDDDTEILTRQRLTSTRREALSLYRDIIRATRFFMWPDSRGLLWRDILRENTRKEFEEARSERDPEVITRLLIGGREALQSALDKLVEKQKQEIQKQQDNSKSSPIL